jgi:hypothetical protein
VTHLLPTQALVSLVAAVQACQVDFDFSNIDIVLDRNLLRKLFRWVNHLPTDDFRIELHVAHNTLLATRCPWGEPSPAFGFGKGFEAAFAQSEVEDRYQYMFNGMHSRVVRYVSCYGGRERTASFQACH